MHAKHVFKLMRPVEWSKSLFNMLFGSVFGLYLLFGSSWKFHFDLSLFVAAFIVVGPLLWSGLYVLNDWTDREKDSHHPVKKLRPIPSGKVHANFALTWAFLLILSAFLVAMQISFLFFLCVGAMFLNQYLYTMPPIRLKERKYLDLISGSLVNPLFRFYAGWVLFIPAFSAPLEILLIVLLGQFGGYVMYRMNGKSHEKKLGYKSSIVSIDEKNIRIVAQVSLLVSLVAFIYASLTILPMHLLWLIPLALLLSPIYGPALIDPEHIDLKKVYWAMYLNLLLVILAFIGIFFFL